MVFIGYETVAHSKAYRMYDPATKKVHISRDVVFEEEKAWRWDNEPDGANANNEPFVVEFSTHLDAGVEVAKDGLRDDPQEIENSEDIGVFDTPVNDGLTEDGDGFADHYPELEVWNPEDPPATPVQAAPNSPRTPAAASVGASSESEPLRLRNVSSIYRDTVPIDFEYSGLCLLGIEEPGNYNEAKDVPSWRRAMEEELSSINDNKTWTLTTLPAGHKAIGLKWVFKLKRDSKGEVVKHKARLVAKGYVQRQGIDFEEVFAPVARLETVRLLIAIAAQEGWQVHHMDVKSAFLNGDLVEEVYVAQAPGFEKKGEEHKVLKLHKALYGLRQAPRAWNSKLDKSLVALGFEKCPLEHAVYKRSRKGDRLLVGVYVDDLIITGGSAKEIDAFKNQMKTLFSISDLGLLSYYLGIEVHQSSGKISLSQAAYAAKILDKCGMKDCNPTLIPMDPRAKLSKESSNPLVDSTQYRSIVGSLRYLIHTRPDIAHSVGIVSRFMEKPTTEHLAAVKQVLRYVKGTLDHGCVYEKGEEGLKVHGYSDSDLAGDIDDRKSTSGMVFYLGCNPISWCSQKQKVVALSSCEAEYIAASSAACQGLWLGRLLTDLMMKKEVEPVVLRIDNQSAIALCKNPVFHERTKHIEIRYHFIRDCVEAGSIDVQYVCTNEQLADILTKALSRPKFQEMRCKIGVQEMKEGRIRQA
jgi:hypothetical protein